MNINDYSAIMNDMQRYLELYGDKGFAPPPGVGTVSRTSGENVQIQIDPLQDLVVGGVIQSEVAGVKIVRKVGTPPKNWRDGQLLADIPKDQLIDVGMTNTARSFKTTAPGLNNGNRVFFGLFTYSKKGAHNETSTSIYEPKDSWKIAFINNVTDNNESVTPWTGIGDNASWGTMRPGAYGSWLNWSYFANAKPYMVGWDGKAYYQLDVNDYTKQADGSPSHIMDKGFPGGAYVWLPRAFTKRSIGPNKESRVEFASTWQDNTWSGMPFVDHNYQWLEGLWIPMFFPDSANRVLPNSNPVVSESYSQQYWRCRDMGDRVRMMDWHTWAFMRDLIHGVTGTVNSRAVFGNGADKARVNNMVSGWMRKSGGAGDPSKFMHSVCFTNNAVGIRIYDLWMNSGGQINRTIGGVHHMPTTVAEFKNSYSWMGTTASKNFNVWAGLIHNGQEPTDEPLIPWTGQGSNDGWDKFVVGDWTNADLWMAIVGGNESQKGEGGPAHIQFNMEYNAQNAAVTYLPIIEPPVGYSPVGM